MKLHLLPGRTGCAQPAAGADSPEPARRTSRRAGFIAPLGAVLSLVLSGCTRVVVDGSSSGYRSGVDDRVSVQRGAEGGLTSEVREILVENQFGPVVLEGTDGDLGWSWKLACWGKDTTEAEAQATHWRMDTSVEGSRAQFRLVTDLGSRERRRIESELRIRAPRTASVEILNSFGEVQVRTLEGTARIRSQNGRVSLQQVQGAVRASTSFAPLEVEAVGAAELENQHGAVRVAHVAGTLVARTSFAELTAETVRGKATLRNQNGAIQANQVHGDLDAETSFNRLQAHGVAGTADLRNQNGAIEAREVTGAIRARTSFASIEAEGDSPIVDARNQNGAIRILARSEQTEQIEASTSFGRIEVQLPPNATPVIRAETTFGQINSDFPVLLWSSVSDSQFAADAGRPKLTLRGQNSEISIRKTAGR